MSWVTSTTVLPSSCCSRRNSSCSRTRTTGSTAPNGSSISSTGGSAASARATPDPLPLAAGELVRVAVGVRRRVEPDQLHQLVGALARGRLGLAVQQRHRHHVGDDRLVREQPDLLDDVADAAPQLDRVLAW